MRRRWLCTCQECLFEILQSAPNKGAKKCPQCKSESFDSGHEVEIDEKNRLIDYEYDSAWEKVPGTRQVRALNTKKWARSE